jgi:hypothetical protein
MMSFVDLTYPSSPNLRSVAQQPAINAPGRDPAIEGEAYTPPFYPRVMRIHYVTEENKPTRPLCANKVLIIANGL